MNFLSAYKRFQRHTNRINMKWYMGVKKMRTVGESRDMKRNKKKEKNLHCIAYSLGQRNFVSVFGYDG